jgi:ferredoxin
VEKILVDLDRCSGHGLCEVMASEIFGLDEDGFCVIKKEIVAGEEANLAREAMLACPTEAIEMVVVEVSEAAGQ